MMCGRQPSRIQWERRMQKPSVQRARALVMVVLLVLISGTVAVLVKRAGPAKAGAPTSKDVSAQALSSDAAPTAQPPKDGSPLGTDQPNGSGASAAAPTSVEFAPQFTAAGTPASAPEKFPLWNLSTPPPGSEAAIPATSKVLSLDLEGDGRRAAFVRTEAQNATSLFVWQFTSPPIRMALPQGIETATVHEVLWSRFNRNVYLLLEQSGAWKIIATEVHGEQLGPVRTVYTSQKPLTNLRTSSVLYAGSERLFFARSYASGRYQILSVLAQGGRVIELTSPSGKTTELTDAALRTKSGEDPEKARASSPQVERVVSAKPLTVHAFNGMMLWQDEQGSTYQRAYGGGNWDESSTRVASMPKDVDITDTANGTFRLRHTPGSRGVELLNADHKVVMTIGEQLDFHGRPVVAASGRSLVGVVSAGAQGGERLTVVGIPSKLAAARYLRTEHLITSRAGQQPGGTQTVPDSDLERNGILLSATQHDQIYNTYESLEYTSCHDEVIVPIFASIDGYLELLAAGFQAVFMATEQNVSRPRLALFLSELETVARRASLSRVQRIAALTKQFLAGDYKSEEGKRVLAEQRTESTLHTVPDSRQIDFGDFHPRGPYSATPVLQNYFRAFKYINLLALTEAEMAALATDTRLRTAWQNWVDTQKPFLQGSRHPPLFDSTRPRTPHADPKCLSAMPPLVFPLSWGADAEIFDRVVAHPTRPEPCGVAERPLPSGLDLMVALGSPEAAALSEKEYAKFPGLREAHAALKARFGRPLPWSLTPEAWLHLVQILGTDRYVPEGVSPVLWRRRMLQTALASWTNFRHTTVLVNEVGGAECGGPDWSPFEELSSEPLRGAVDPLPAAWRQLAATTRLLAAQAKIALPDLSVDATLREVADGAESFAKMADRQLRGEPLTNAEYQQIQTYVGAIEHPFVLLKSTIADAHDSGEHGLSIPDPMTKIVDVASAGPTHFHMAIGTPIKVVVLLGDRGILVPAEGAVYSYREVIANTRLDDDMWRKRLKQNPPAGPDWLTSVMP